jgi:hypothetical protein
MKSLDHPQHPRGTRHRINPAGVRISSIALTLQSPSPLYSWLIIS